MMERVVEAKSEDHSRLIAEGWSPLRAWQTFDHQESLRNIPATSVSKSGITMMLPAHQFIEHTLKPVTKVMVSMVKCSI